MANKDYYKTLGVDKSATESEIKKAFRKLARKHHPDAGGNEDTFKQINEAYEILGDKDKRKQYDEYGQYFGPDGPPPGYGSYGAGGAGGGSGFGGYSYSGSPGGGYQQVNMEDFDLGDIFSSMFGGSAGGGGFGGFGRNRAQKGADLSASIEISFEEAFSGTTVKMQSADGREISVNVPAGANDGGKLRFKGKGSPGSKGAPAGDLLVETKIRPHRYFTREKSDVILELPLTVVEASLGTEVSVPLPTGEKAKLKVPAGTQDGKVFRMKGKGAPKLKGGGHGDLKVKVKLVVPRELSEDQAELLRKFEASLKASDTGENLRKHLK